MKMLLRAVIFICAITLTGHASENLLCQLGILDLTANDGLNPATGESWQVGDMYRLVFISSTPVECHLK